MQSVFSQLGGAKSISCNTTCLQPHFAQRWHLGHGSGLQWHHLLERQQISLAIPPERIRAHRKNWMISWRSLTLTSKMLSLTWLIYAPSPFLPFFQIHFYSKKCSLFFRVQNIFQFVIPLSRCWDMWFENAINIFSHIPRQIYCCIVFVLISIPNTMKVWL